jgi:predicted TIM-barrel fold metal-dependent hydrolase
VREYPQRFAALACITSHDPSTAAHQLRKAAEWGLRGAEMNVSKMVVPLYYEEWDVLWAASNETQMPISFHTLGLPSRKPDPDRAERYYHVSDGVREVLFQLSGAEFLTSAVYSGACDRFPDFKFVLGECGIGWIPYVIERTDVEYADRLFQLGLDMKPSDYWHRQGHSTFQQEYVTVDEVERIGVDSIMWGSDYPHPDGVFPDSKKVIEQGLGHLPADIFKKITCDNAAALYRFN